MNVGAWILLLLATPLIFVKTMAPPKPVSMKACFGESRLIEIDDDSFPTAEKIIELESQMPPCEHAWFDSCYEGAKLHYRYWLPKKPKAAMIFMHGICAHGGTGDILPNGRKVNLSLMAENCLSQDIALYAFDLYGHGYSEGTRSFIPETWENNRNDLIAFCDIVSSKHSDSPLFLMGESYGCTLSIHTARYFQDNPEKAPKNFDSLILMAPAIIGDLPPFPVFQILVGLAKLFPKWTPFFMPNTISPDRIWRDPEVLKLRTDPEYKKLGIDGSGVRFRLGTALNLVRALEEARKTAIPGLNTPFLIIHGSDDWGVPIAGSEYMCEQATSTDKKFLRKEGAYHDLLSDFVADECGQDVLDWINGRTGRK